MPVANPHYDPHWEALYDYHHKHYERLEKEIETRFNDTKALDIQSEEYRKLNTALDFHHETCLHCLDTLRHKTVQDYYEWRTSDNYFEHPAFKECDIHIPNPEHFKTLEQAREAVLKINNIIGKYKTLERCKAKAGRPDGLDIFEKRHGNRLCTNWKHYMLKNTNGKPLPDLVTLLTVDDRHSVKHVCFFADDHEDRKFVLPYLKYLAAAFIEEDSGKRYIDYCIGKNKERKQTFKWRQKLCGTKPLPNYHFYIHTMPNGIHGESLYKFSMKHNWNVNYRPEHAHPTQVLLHHHYETVPKALIEAANENIGFHDICLECYQR